MTNHISIMSIKNYPPDILIEISRELCGTFDFFKAEELVEIQLNKHNMLFWAMWFSPAYQSYFFPFISFNTFLALSLFGSNSRDLSGMLHPGYHISSIHSPGIKNIGEFHGFQKFQNRCIESHVQKTDKLTSLRRFVRFLQFC